MAGEPHLEEEVWAVELSDSSKCNSEMMKLVMGDTAVIKDKKLSLHLLAFTTASSSSRDELIIEHSAASCSGCAVSKGVQPEALPLDHTFHTLVKTKPRLALNWTAKHEEGLLLVAAHVKATRVYMHTKKTAVNSVKKISLSMPGGCTVMGVCGGKRVSKFTAPSVDLFDSTGTLERRHNASEVNDGSASESSFSLAEDVSFSLPVSYQNSEIGSPQFSRSSTSADVFGPQSFSDGGPLRRTPTAPAYSPHSFFNSGIDDEASFSAQFPLHRMPSCDSEIAGFMPQHDISSMSAQFILQRPDAIGYHSGPMIQFYGSPTPRCQTSSPLGTPGASSSIEIGSKGGRNRLQGFAQRMVDIGSLKERGFLKHGSEKERQFHRAGSENERALG